MATPYEIPLTPAPQAFQVRLAGTVYGLRVTYNQYSGWVLDISSALGAPIVQGLPLVTGADLLGQLRHLGIGGQLIVQTDHDLTAPPTADNLGLNSHLYFLAD